MEKLATLCLPQTCCDELVKDGYIVTDATAMEKMFSIKGDEIVNSSAVSYANGYKSALIDMAKAVTIGVVVGGMVYVTLTMVETYKRNKILNKITKPFKKNGKKRVIAKSKKQEA